MSLNKKIVITIIVVILLVGILLLLIISKKTKPLEVIGNKINLTIPPSSKIINYNYDRWNDYLDAKIMIDEVDLYNVQKELVKCFGQEFDYMNENYLPNFENVVTWWDMDKSNIEACYFKFASGKKHLFTSSPKTVEIWAFIVKQNDGQYYLYISY